MAYLHVYFKDEFILQYKRDQLYGIEDLVCKYYDAALWDKTPENIFWKIFLARTMYLQTYLFIRDTIAFVKLGILAFL